MEVLSLYQELNDMGVSFYHWNMTGYARAATIERNGHYGVFMDFDAMETSAEEKVDVAHEGGHIATGSTHAVESPYDLIALHENRADKWAIKKLVPKDELDKAVAEGRTELWELNLRRK